MASARRLFVLGVVALAGAACGLEVVGVDPGIASDAGADRVAPSLPDPSAPDAPVADAGCVYTGGFCNPCDPSLVLCIELGKDGGIVDESGYHRAVEVVGTPTFVTTPNGQTAASLDGSVDIRIASGPGLENDTDDTVEVVARIGRGPDAGARAGIVDRNGSTAMFVRRDDAGAYLQCRNMRTPSGTPIAGFRRISCTTTLGGEGGIYLDSSPILASDAGRGAAAFVADEPFVIGKNSPSGDVFVGDLSSIRVYTRARTPEELADGGP